MNSIKQVFDITRYSCGGGWASKVGPEVLNKIVHKLPQQFNDKLIHGFDNSEDASVYELDEFNYLLNTVDFFTPLYHEPYIFGQITAANACSDIFAMGGKVINCLNILAFPSDVPAEVITEILSGAIDKVKEAGGVVAGGHTISTDHIIYGLAVTGIVEKSKLKTNDGAKANQKIILTKRLGVGIYSKEINKNKDLPDCQEVIKSMTTLNKTAADIMHKYRVTACTDVTGFGLLGHLSEVMAASKLSAKLYMEQIPLFARTYELAIEYANGGMRRNASYFGNKIQFENEAKMEENINILFDPQTSGGLLLFVDESDSQALLTELHQAGIVEAAIIGETVKQQEKLITVFRSKDE